MSIKAFDILNGDGLPALFEEVADLNLMRLISDCKGDYESALEHYIMA
jgi:hypothetical protein